MREILFRGKRVDNGEWVYGYVTRFRNVRNQVYTAIIQICDDETKECDIQDLVPVLDETICEFTGLTDKNGNKIFEGDILSFTVFDYNNNDIQYKGVVKWSDTEKLATRFMIWHDNENEYYGNDGAFDFDWVHYQDSEIEIIGNIYDNPELLEK